MGREVVEALDLVGFEAALRRRGLSDLTIKTYCDRVRQGGPERATNRALAPKSRHLIVSSWRAYARYTKNGQLIAELDEIRLPPAARKKPQAPLPDDIYRQLRESLTDDPLDAVIGMMACRGLRRADALGLERREIRRGAEDGQLSYRGKGDKRHEMTVLSTFARHVRALHVGFESTPRSKIAVDLVSGNADAAAKRIDKRLAAIARELGFEGMHSHLMRRSYATAFYEKVKDPVRLQQHMGWAAVQTALGYVDHARREELDQVAETLFDDEPLPSRPILRVE